MTTLTAWRGLSRERSLCNGAYYSKVLYGRIRSIALAADLNANDTDDDGDDDDAGGGDDDDF